MKKDNQDEDVTIEEVFLDRDRDGRESVPYTTTQAAD